MNKYIAFVVLLMYGGGLCASDATGSRFVSLSLVEFDSRPASSEDLQIHVDTPVARACQGSVSPRSILKGSQSSISPLPVSVSPFPKKVRISPTPSLSCVAITITHALTHGQAEKAQQIIDAMGQERTFTRQMRQEVEESLPMIALVIMQDGTSNKDAACTAMTKLSNKLVDLKTQSMDCFDGK